MTIFSATPHRRQTAWQCGTRNTNWYAYIDAPIEDLTIIEDAKTIVDACRPQKHGPFGATFYSFLTREYLLNILLFHYADHGAFPEGSLCIVDEWVWKTVPEWVVAIGSLGEPKVTLATLNALFGSAFQVLPKHVQSSTILEMRNEFTTHRNYTLEPRSWWLRNVKTSTNFRI